MSFASDSLFMMSSTNGRSSLEGENDADSAPTAMPMSIDPVTIWFAMSWVAFNPDEQNLAVEDAEVVLGKPAASAAALQYRPALPSRTCHLSVFVAVE